MTLPNDNVGHRPRLLSRASPLPPLCLAPPSSPVLPAPSPLHLDSLLLPTLQTTRPRSAMPSLRSSPTSRSETQHNRPSLTSSLRPARSALARPPPPVQLSSQSASSALLAPPTSPLPPPPQLLLAQLVLHRPSLLLSQPLSAL